MLQAILNHVFTVRDARKYTTTIRRIVTKLIIRVGVDKVKAGTPVTHQALVLYVERQRRKKINAASKARMLALLGQKATVKKDDKKTGEDDSSDDSEADDEADMADEAESNASDSEQSEDEDYDAAARQGVDTLQSSNRLDIPVVTDIPVVSQLAKA